MVRSLLIAIFVTVASAVALGQQPNRKPEPYVAPLLPGEVGWEITLPAAPVADGVMDRSHVYVPLGRLVSTNGEGERAEVAGSASLVAIDREAGVVRWRTRVEATAAPVAAPGTVIVPAASHLHGLSAFNGFPLWNVPLDRPLRGRMLLRGNLLVGLMEPAELVAFRLDTKEIAWRRDTGESGAVSMAADHTRLYLTTAGGRVIAVRLTDGAIAWERVLEGALSEPSLGRDRVFVGSTTNAFWALDADSGTVEWQWAAGRIFGGDVIGSAVEDDVVYVASLDNIVRALNRGNGNQRWKKDIGTRPVLSPRAFFGTVVVFGLSPTVTTFVGKTGTPAGSWSAPAEAELQGAPLIDEYLRPYSVAMVVITRDGRVTALRPKAMLFTEPAAGTLTTLPGRVLPVERLPGDVSPSAPPVSPQPRQ